MPNKLVIHAFKDENLRQHVGKFQLQVNPEKITRSDQNDYAPVRPIKGAVRLKQFAGVGDSGLDMEFVIDATGVIPETPAVTSVRDKLTELRQTACDFEGDIHSAPYLRVIWGDLNYPCRYRSMSVDYTLFSPKGIPLRARVSMKFARHEAADTQLRNARTSSADLTHARVVKAGETLPLLCQEIYREDRLYPQVARYNDLDTLVALAPGSRVSLPPLRD